jgi:class 3 adenylate cyclase
MLGSSPATDTEPTAPPQLNPVVFRLLAGLAVVAIAAASFDNALGRPLFLGIALGTLAYVVATFAATHTRAGQKPNPALLRILDSLDALLLGIFIAYIGLDVVPLVILGTMVLVRALAYGGFPRLLEQMAVFTVGLVATLTLREPVWLAPATRVNSLALLTVPFYFCLMAYHLHRQNRTLAQSMEATKKALVDLKLSNYKLSKYLSPTLRKAILSGKKVKLETQRKKITIFFSDIQGFSELSEQLEADVLTQLLNSYLSEMSDIAIRYGGTVDKFIGDAIMVFFGDPVSRGVKSDCVACVSMAIEMQRRMKELHQRWNSQGIRRPLNVRMGINTGFCTVGNFGTENRLDYTLLGTEVNLASRLESAASAGEILISRETYELVKDVIMCREREPVKLKGFQDPVKVYSVVDLRRNLGKEQNYLEHVTEGFNIYLETDKVPNYERDKVIASLEQAYRQLRRKTKPQ